MSSDTDERGWLIEDRCVWRPIETAPRDATAILVMRDIWPGTESGRAEECNGHNTYVAQWWAGERSGRGAWICYMGATLDPECPVEPTHWMPLPPPPSAAAVHHEAPEPNQPKAEGESILREALARLHSIAKRAGSVVFQSSWEADMFNEAMEAARSALAGIPLNASPNVSGDQSGALLPAVQRPDGATER